MNHFKICCSLDHKDVVTFRKESDSVAVIINAYKRNTKLDHTYQVPLTTFLNWALREQLASDQPDGQLVLGSGATLSLSFSTYHNVTYLRLNIDDGKVIAMKGFYFSVETRQGLILWLQGLLEPVDPPVFGLGF